MIIICFVLFVLAVAITEYDKSVDYTIKGFWHLGLFVLSGVIIYYFTKVPKDNLSLTYLFSLVGQFIFVFFLGLFSMDYQSFKDKTLAQNFVEMGSHETEMLTRLSLCEKAFVDYGNEGHGVVSSIEDTCHKMVVDVVRSSPLNIPPTLELISRLENQEKSKRYFANLKLCVIAEAGEINLAVQMAAENKFPRTLKTLKESGHCRMFQKREVASEL